MGLSVIDFRWNELSFLKNDIVKSKYLKVNIKSLITNYK